MNSDQLRTRPVISRHQTIRISIRPERVAITFSTDENGRAFEFNSTFSIWSHPTQLGKIKKRLSFISFNFIGPLQTAPCYT